MTTANRSLATAPWRARFASGLLPPSYTTTGDVTGRSTDCIPAHAAEPWPPAPALYPRACGELICLNLTPARKRVYPRALSGACIYCFPFFFRFSNVWTVQKRRRRGFQALRPPPPGACLPQPSDCLRGHFRLVWKGPFATIWLLTLALSFGPFSSTRSRPPRISSAAPCRREPSVPKSLSARTNKWKFLAPQPKVVERLE